MVWHIMPAWLNGASYGQTRVQAASSRQHIPPRGQLRLLTLTTEEVIGKKHFIPSSAQHLNTM